ncbi:mavicyanin-like [Pyrus ussuriensis x Pyrus communis]|uniref:Mavicyanin-like n=1 Tax=Pyrus ussuriensis x Pyrus communis TaxID=2448454 RepID=A0A5N5FBG3_9ROSA|nr:mavicyanin-like [Pyrus ussuriensis x Pyrus communis]
MAKLPQILVCVLLVLGFALTSSATVYTVGDTSGWDISTDLNSWSNNKTFKVGDALSFQYSSSNSVSQVTKESFDVCNTTKVIKTYTGGNTTVTLTKPGDWYFVSGSKLYCLGGMKLVAEVENNQAYEPAGAPEAGTGSRQGDLPNPTTKSNSPTSSAFINCGPNAFVLAIFGLIAATLYMEVTI